MRSQSKAEHSAHDEESQELRGVYASSEKRTKKKNIITAYNAHGGSTSEVGEDKEEKEVEEHEHIMKPGSDGDICHSVMERYARSLAPQHRHLCATASAMRSILSEEGLPLTPPAYFAAAITAIRDLDTADLEGMAALSAFVAIVLPLVPADSLPKAKAKDAAFILISFMRDNASALPTGSLRSMVKSLGSLILLLDLEDWPSVELPLETLVFFALDRRPKVRRCAQSCLEMIFKNHPKSPSIKRAGKFILSIYQKHISLVKKPDSTEPAVTLKGTETATGHMEVLHMLNFLNIIIPYLSAKVRLKILCDVYKLLGYHFSWSTRHILRLLLVLLELSKVKAIVTEAESIMSALALYTSAAEKNPIDTIITSSTISNYVLKKLRDACPGLWTRYLPLLFTSLIGYLRFESETSRQVARIMKELIEIHMCQRPFRNANQSVNYDMSTHEATAVASLCSTFEKALESCRFPTDHMSEVITILFLKLGESSYFFMKKIVLGLSQFAATVKEGMPCMNSFEQCIGAAVVAMGPEKLLSLLPIAFDMDKLTCSNTWIIPILRKHVIGASLQFFMDNVVPLAQSLQEACKNVKEESALNNLQSCFHSLWDLLPAFCSYPIDTEKIEAFSMWLMVVLKEEPSLHEIIALALKVLIYSNREDRRQCMEEPNSILFNQFSMDLKIFQYSKKTASRNLKALATRSTEFFQILKDIFFDSSEKRVYIKDALGCLGFILPSEYIRNFFLSSMESVKQLDNLIESESFDDNVQEENKEIGHDKVTRRKNEEKRFLLMELASSFVEAADADLIYTIFEITKSSLSENNGMCQREGYYTLSLILKEKYWFCSVQLDELLDILFAVKPLTDKIILEHRFSCFNYLLTHMLKSNGADVNTKAFLILNEIITTLKSKKQSRKLAYDALLNITSRLKNSQSAIMDSDLMRLFNMVLGYLSCSSPHIMSGAVSALSLLIHHDATFCLSVPNLIPSVLSLLQKKATEVVKATLGFIKVLVSSLNCNDLISLLPDIIDGILPWSSVSKHHFRSKVGLILEILIRKCTFEAVEIQASGNYKGFVKSIKEGRRNKKKRKGADNADLPDKSSHSASNRGKKRLHNDVSTPSEKGSREDSNIHNKNTVKRLQNGFSNSNSTGKGAYNRFKHQSSTSSRPNSQNHIKQQQRSTGNYSKRRNGDKQKPSSTISARRNVTKRKRTAKVRSLPSL